MLYTIIPIIMILASLAGVANYVIPQYEETNLLKEDIANLKDTLVKAEEIKTVAISLKNTLNSLPKSRIARIESIIPESIDPLKVLNDLNGIASTNSMLVQALNIQDDTTPNRGNTQPSLRNPVIKPTTAVDPLYKTIVVDMSVVGTYSSFQKFLADLERSNQLFDVNSLTVNPSDEGLYGFTMTLQTYTRK